MFCADALGSAAPCFLPFSAPAARKSIQGGSAPRKSCATKAAPYLVDCGSGVTQRLQAAGSSGADVDAVFFTHLHSDHTVDLFQLIISSWHQGRNRPHLIYDPKGTKRYVNGLLKL